MTLYTRIFPMHKSCPSNLKIFTLRAFQDLESPRTATKRRVTKAVMDSLSYVQDLDYGEVGSSQRLGNLIELIYIRFEEESTSSPYTMIEVVEDCYNVLTLAAKPDQVPKSRQERQRAFAFFLVKFVDAILGKDAGKTLRQIFKDHKVKYSKPKTLTPEQKRAAHERLIAGRIKRMREELKREIGEDNEDA